MSDSPPEKSGLTTHQAADASQFACELEACIIAYIHAWEIRAKPFADEFADSRVDAAMALLDPLSPDTEKMCQQMNWAMGQFIKELDAAVTTLELDSLLNKITSLLLKNKLPEWISANKYGLRCVLSPHEIEPDVPDQYAVFKSMGAGAVAGAAIGTPIAVVGMVPGAIFGAIAGFFAGGKWNRVAIINETKAKVRQFVSHSVGVLNATKPFVLKDALVYSGRGDADWALKRGISAAKPQVAIPCSPASGEK